MIKTLILVVVNQGASIVGCMGFLYEKDLIKSVDTMTITS